MALHPSVRNLALASIALLVGCDERQAPTALEAPIAGQTAGGGAGG